MPATTERRRLGRLFGLAAFRGRAEGLRQRALVGGHFGFANKRRPFLNDELGGLQVAHQMSARLEFATVAHGGCCR